MAPGHTASEWWSQYLNPGSVTLVPTLLLDLPCCGFWATKEIPALAVQGRREVKSFGKIFLSQKIPRQNIFYKSIVCIRVVNSY